MSCVETKKSISYRPLDSQTADDLAEDHGTLSLIEAVTAKMQDYNKEDLTLVEIQSQVKNDSLVCSISEIYLVTDVTATEKRLNEHNGVMDAALATPPFGVFRLELNRKLNKSDLEKIIRINFATRKLIIEIFYDVLKPHLFIEIYSADNSFTPYTIEVDPDWSIKTVNSHLRIVQWT